MSMHLLSGKALARWAGLALLVAAVPLGANQAYDLASGAKAPAKSSPSTNGNGNGNNGNGNGNGGPNGGGSPGKALTAAVTGHTQIAPGVTGSITVRVDNPNNQAVNVTRVAGVVTGVTTGTRQGVAPCNKDWILLGEFVGSQVIDARRSGTVTMPVSFDNKPTMNQDNCKGVTYTFSFTVYGQQA